MQLLTNNIPLFNEMSPCTYKLFNEISVNDLNLAKKHTRPNPQLGITGGIVEKEMPIILQKCVRVYLDYAQKYQDQDIWNVIPE